MSNKIIPYLIVAALLVLFSCDEKPVFVNCNECVADEPLTAGIKIKLEAETGNWVLINVYRGAIEDSVLVDTITTDSVDYTYTGEVNTKYTFTAEYHIVSGKIIVAVDTAWPRVKYEKQQCQDPCYFIYDNNVNLRIKYH
jgi:hypothetical protein